MESGQIGTPDCAELDTATRFRKKTISQSSSSTKSLYLKGVTEYNKIKKKLKYEGSDIKLFRTKVEDDMLKRRLYRSHENIGTSRCLLDVLIGRLDF